MRTRPYSHSFARSGIWASGSPERQPGSAQLKPYWPRALQDPHTDCVSELFRNYPRIRDRPRIRPNQGHAWQRVGAAASAEVRTEYWRLRLRHGL